MICNFRNAVLRGVPPEVLSYCPHFSPAQARLSCRPIHTPEELAELNGVIRSARDYLMSYKKTFSAEESYAYVHDDVDDCDPGNLALKLSGKAPETGGASRIPADQNPGGGSVA